MTYGLTLQFNCLRIYIYYIKRVNIGTISSAITNTPQWNTSGGIHVTWTMFYNTLNIKWIYCVLLVLTLYKLCTDAISELRFAAKPFSEMTYLAGRKVMCDTQDLNDLKKLYPEHSYRCYNMRIDNMRLRSLNLKLLVKQGKKSSPTVSAERNYTAKNNIAGLCTALLKEHGETTPLWTAYASDATLKKNNGSLIFVTNSSGSSWEVTPNGKFYIHTLTCMLMDDS